MSAKYRRALDVAIGALLAADEALSALQKLEGDEDFARELDSLEMRIERTVDALIQSAGTLDTIAEREEEVTR